MPGLYKHTDPAGLTWTFREIGRVSGSGCRASSGDACRVSILVESATGRQHVTCPIEEWVSGRPNLSRLLSEARPFAGPIPLSEAPRH